MKVAAIELAAEFHYFFRRQLDASLRNFVLSEDARGHLGEVAMGRPDLTTYRDWCDHTHALDFVDSTTLIRIATGIEVGLGQWFASKTRGARVEKGTFQRLDAKTLRLVSEATGCDLTSLQAWDGLREIMCHRHLYSHRSGLVDLLYIEKLRTLTGEDIEPAVREMGWPQEDVYWFRPLAHLPRYIEEARAFFRDLPA